MREERVWGDQKLKIEHTLQYSKHFKNEDSYISAGNTMKTQK